MCKSGIQMTGLALALLMLVLPISGCTMLPQISFEEEVLPEETIEALEDAINTMDAAAMLDLMDEDIQDMIESTLSITMGIVSSLTGVDIDIEAEDLLNILPLLQTMVPTDAYGDYEQVDFEVTATYIKGDKATVYFTELNSGEELYLNLKKEDGEWLITMDSFEINEDNATRIIIDGTEQ